MMVPVVQAELVDFSFVGVIDFVVDTPPQPFETAQEGDLVVIEYTVDTSVADTESAPEIGIYNGSVIEMTVTIDGDAMAMTNIDGLSVTDLGDLGLGDGYSVSGVFQVGFSQFIAGISLQDPTGTAFDSDANPQEIDLTDFELREFNIVTIDEGDTLISGPLLLPSEIPEPATTMLISLGSIVAATTHRRRPRVRREVPSRLRVRRDA